MRTEDFTRKRVSRRAPFFVLVSHGASFDLCLNRLKGIRVVSELEWSIKEETVETEFIITVDKERIVLSLLMSFLMLLSIYLYSRVRGSGSAELVPRAVLELMATWGLCQCAFTVLSNVIGLYIKPLYMIFITLFSYALGIVLMLTRHPAANFFPTVQGMLYAHRSIFGRLEEGFFTPAFSAGYLSAVILALSAFGAMRIRKKDLL